MKKGRISNKKVKLDLKKIKKINWKVLLISFLIVQIVAIIGSIFTSQGTKTAWYDMIKPEITPPNLVFPIVWNILFFLIAFSLYFSWVNANRKDKTKIIFVFSLNFLFNILWSFLFFKLRSPIFAFYELAFLLWPSILLMIYVTGKINHVSSDLLYPYLFWVGFAGVLNYLVL